MRKRRNLLIILLLRGCGLIIFLAVVVTLIYYLLFFRAGKVKTPLPSLPSSRVVSQKIEQQEGVRFIEFRGERGRIEVRAGRHTAVSEGQYRLEGGVEIHDFGRRPNLEAWINCREALYDREWTKVVLTGEVILKRQGVELMADRVVYHRAGETFEAEGRVTLKIKRLRTSSERLFYSLREENVRLEQRVNLRWETDEGVEPSYALQSEVFLYDRLNHHGRAEGNIRFSHGKDQGEAEWAEFDLSEDEMFLRRLELGGGVRGWGETSSFRSEISAARLKVRPFLNSSRIHSLEAEDACQLRLTQPEEETALSSERLAVVFDRWGKLREIRADGRALWKRKNLTTGEEQVVKGENVSFVAGKNHLQALGKGEEIASLDSSRVSLIAEKMTVNTSTRDLEALGNVRATVFPPEAADERPAGIFSEKKPFYASARTFLWAEQVGRFFLEGEVRMWQEDISLHAEKVILDEKTQELEARDQVRMAVVRKPRKESTELKGAKITASRLQYSPVQRALHFAGPCELQSTELRILTQELVAFLQKDSDEVEQLEARGDVRIFTGKAQARGEKGVYDWGKEVFILEGKPVLEDPVQGSIRGDKLTFHLSDGRILVENQGRERSLSIVKSEK